MSLRIPRVTRGIRRLIPRLGVLFWKHFAKPELQYHQSIICCRRPRCRPDWIGRFSFLCGTDIAAVRPCAGVPSTPAAHAARLAGYCPKGRPLASPTSVAEFLDLVRKSGVTDEKR